MLQLRVDNARLSQAEAALRAKSDSLEEALHALEAKLSEYEVEAMGQHAILEQDKQQARHFTISAEHAVFPLWNDRHDQKSRSSISA